MEAKKILTQLQYPSTKRGVVMLILGAVMIYQGLSGAGDVDFYALMGKIQRIVENGFSILGFGLTLVGILGFLPDQPNKNRPTLDNPNDAQIVDVLGIDPAADRVRRDAAVSSQRADDAETHSVGFGDH